MLDVKRPAAVTGPSRVRLPAMVGVGLVPQHTPCCVGLGTPGSVMSPLPMAVLVPMAVTANVVSVVAWGRVVKLTWLP